VRRLLPLREPTFFILLALAPASGASGAGKHGYALLQEVEALSEGKLRLSTGTLYEALKRMLEEGLVERVEEREGGADTALRPGKPRKIYRLSRLGWQVLEAEAKRMQSLAAAAQRRLVQQQRGRPG
jgi:DNA-binding PadR family transcriptional regulator